MTLDDLYNHLKVYEAEVQKKSNSNSQDMAFFSSSKNSSNEDGNTVCVTTAGTAFPTGSVNVATIIQDTASAYIASQSNAKEKSSKALMAIDGVEWDWSYMANEEDHALVADGEAPTKFALMANIENRLFDNSLCSNECKKNTDSLNSKIKDLKRELSKANNFIYHYKLDVAQLEGRLIEYKEREVQYIEKIRILEMYRASNLDSIKILTKELEEVKL
uniref:Uncharacterized protein n=1 Tax=Tanacetum cinerariifolium TaxID=118510 RepID=A0A699Q027_TANCI|nr:hypothetical protein [Tanacetum cinerariifolium]